MQRRHDARVQRLHFFEAGGRVLPLGRGALVDPDADEDLAEEGEDAGDVVQAADEGGLAEGLGEVGAWRDATRGRDGGVTEGG